MFFDHSEKHCVNADLPEGDWPKVVENPYSIPLFCPLPDKQESKELKDKICDYLNDIGFDLPGLAGIIKAKKIKGIWQLKQLQKPTP
jgi:hypothetical protein